MLVHELVPLADDCHWIVPVLPVSDTVAVEPEQIVAAVAAAVPATEVEFTVITLVLERLLQDPPTVSAYVIVAVPADKPVTTPAGDTVATEVFELVHAPPEVVLESVLVPPTQSTSFPVIGAGVG